MPSLVLSMLLRTKRFVTGNGHGPAGSSLDKAQLRRAQVRKAQIQHRQRKANYVKQLEMDVAGIRDKIAATQRETQLLRRENDVIRTRIQQPYFISSNDVDLGYGLDDITLRLAFDDVLSAPAFCVSSSPSDSQYENSQRSPLLPVTTPDQTQEAINFILSLEHICRNHFDSARVGDANSRESGHTLMATSLALRTAPDAVFAAASRSSPLLRRAQPSDLPTGTQEVSWQAQGLTLHTLHGLACSINAADVEITPVQAWFELAGRFPLEVLLRRDVLDELKRELAPVVKCPHYGAQMERRAYESVVARVMGGFPQGGGGCLQEHVMV